MGRGTSPDEAVAASVDKLGEKGIALASKN